LRESRLKSTDKWNDAPKRPDRSERTGDRVRRRFDGPQQPGRGSWSDRPPRRYAGRDEERPFRRDRDGDRPYRRKGKAPAKKQADLPEEGLIRLNRYLAHSGIGSRREADELIRAGVVKVNGEIVTELGVKVKPGKDIVHVEDQKMSMEVKRYVLLNKPKDTITTTDDPQDRKTVMGLVADACEEQIFPVGRLDRNTSGLLLFTNDGDLANRLTHPRYGIEKLYHATLDRNVSVDDLHRLTEGVRLDDGPAQADEVSYVGDSKNEVGVRIHSGRNRVVRRMFESLGYDVVKLDRVLFAGLTKKDLPRGRWRHLTEAEVSLLKRVK
jgi:23S rRNA pseudouridine2605 synthase